MTRLDTEMFGVTVPEYKSLPAPDDAVSTAKWVMVLEPPVAGGKTMSAAGDTEDRNVNWKPPS